MHVALDLDGTLVRWEDRTWYDGALKVMRGLERDGVKLVLHTCRTQMPGGMEEIELLLAKTPVKLDVWTGPGKPIAAAYVDDRGVEFRGDWAKADREIRWLLANRPEIANPNERPRT